MITSRNEEFSQQAFSSSEFDQSINVALKNIYDAATKALSNPELAIFKLCWANLTNPIDLNSIDDVNQYYGFMLDHGIENNLKAYCDKYNLPREKIDSSVKEMIRLFARFIHQLYKLKFQMVAIEERYHQSQQDQCLVNEIELNINNVDLEKNERSLMVNESFLYSVLKELHANGLYHAELERKRICWDTQSSKLSSELFNQLKALPDISVINKTITNFHQTYELKQKQERKTYRRDLRQYKNNIDTARIQFDRVDQRFNQYQQTILKNTIEQAVSLAKASQEITQLKTFTILSLLKELTNEGTELQTIAKDLCLLNQSNLSKFTFGFLGSNWGAVAKILSDETPQLLLFITNLQTRYYDVIKLGNHLDHLDQLNRIALSKERQLSFLSETIKSRQKRQIMIASDIKNKLSQLSEIIQGHIAINHSYSTYSKEFIKRHWGKLLLGSFSGAGASTTAAMLFLSGTPVIVLILTGTFLGLSSGAGTGLVCDQIKPTNESSMQGEKQPLLAPKYSFCEPVEYPILEMKSVGLTETDQTVEWFVPLVYDVIIDNAPAKDELPANAPTASTWSDYMPQVSFPSFPFWNRTNNTMTAKPLNRNDEIPRNV